MAKSSFTCFLGSFILLPIHGPYDTAICFFRFTGQGRYLSYLFTAYTLHIRFICGRLISINWMHFIWDRTGPHMLHIWYSPKRMDVVNSDIKDSKMLIFSFWKGLNKSFCKWIKNLFIFKSKILKGSIGKAGIFAIRPWNPFIEPLEPNFERLNFYWPWLRWVNSKVLLFRLLSLWELRSCLVNIKGTNLSGINRIYNRTIPLFIQLATWETKGRWRFF